HLHRLAALITGFAANRHHTTVGAGARGHGGHHLGVDLQGVAGAHGTRPLDFAAHTDDAPRTWGRTVDHQPHRDRRRVPSAGREAREQAARGEFFVQMKRLRVELAREGLDLGLAHGSGRADKALADLEVVEIVDVAHCLTNFCTAPFSMARYTSPPPATATPWAPLVVPGSRPTILPSRSRSVPPVQMWSSLVIARPEIPPVPVHSLRNWPVPSKTSMRWLSRSLT